MKKIAITIFFLLLACTRVFGAPIDEIDKLWLSFSSVEVSFTPSGSSTVQQLVVSQGQRTMDLLTLQRGVLKDLGLSTLSTGAVSRMILKKVEAKVQKGGEIFPVRILGTNGESTVQLEGVIPISGGTEVLLVLDFDGAKSLSLNPPKEYSLNPAIPIFTLEQAIGGSISEENAKLQFMTLAIDSPAFSPGNIDGRKDQQNVSFHHVIRTTDELSSAGTTETESFSIQWSADYSDFVSGQIVKTFQETIPVPRPSIPLESLTYPKSFSFLGMGNQGETLPEGHYILILGSTFHKSPGLGPNGQPTNPSKTLDRDKEVRQVIIDNTPPKVAMLFPTLGEVVPHNPFTIRGSFIDNLSGIDIASSKVLMDHNQSIPISETGYSQSIDLADGYHTLGVHLLDHAGNLTEFEGHFTVDALPPEIIFQIPDSPIGTLRPTLIVSYRDAGTMVNSSSVTVSIDNLSFTQQAEISMFLLKLGFSGALKEGLHTITVTVADETGNQATASKIFAVFQPKDPATEVTSGIIGPAGGVLEIDNLFSNLDQVRIEVPQGALNNSVPFTIREIPIPPKPEQRPNWVSLGPIFELGQEAISARKPLIVTIPFFQSHLDYIRETLPKEGIRIITSHDKGQTYEVLPASDILNVDFQKGTVTFQTNSLSFFGIVFGGFTDIIHGIVDFVEGTIKALVSLLQGDVSEALRHYLTGLLEAADSFGLLSPQLPEGNPEHSICSDTSSQNNSPTPIPEDDPITRGDAANNCSLETLKGKNCSITLGREGPATSILGRGIDKFKMDASFLQNLNGGRGRGKGKKLITTGNKVLTIQSATIVEEHEEPYSHRKLLSFLPLPFKTSNGPWANIHLTVLAYRNRQDVPAANCAQFFPKTSGPLGPFAFSRLQESVVSPVVQVSGAFPNRLLGPDILQLVEAFPSDPAITFLRHCEPISDLNGDGNVNGDDSDFILQGPYRTDNPNQCEWLSTETWGFQHIRYQNYGLVDLEQHPDIAGIAFDLYESDEGFYDDPIGQLSLNGEELKDPNFEARAILRDKIGINNMLILKTSALLEEEPPRHRY